MPLFFADLRDQVIELVEYTRSLRERDAAPQFVPGYTQSQGYQLPDWQPLYPPATFDEPLSVVDNGSLTKLVQAIPLDDQELVAQARRLDLFLCDEDAHLLLTGAASEELREQLTCAVRLGFYYEIKDRYLASIGIYGRY
ncbi:hypothetical protein [Dictyobacter kobayashii]|uniref:Uncharacterized protein n=1 Tax=Dictyobacter kobayashii TaxID=2014872 RepID=A0A402AQ86_9CHLR|nr:hypothetical protein [Dictyobacter kobayashii]GCE21276.1 hypothetical protein KDK_50760 [Dictyobacter kobayashii]